MPKVTMYSTWLCPYCTRAKRLLRSKGITVTEIRVDRNPELRDEMHHRSRRNTVPQIFIGDLHVGGFDDLVQLDLRQELDQLLHG